METCPPPPGLACVVTLGLVVLGLTGLMTVGYAVAGTRRDLPRDVLLALLVAGAVGGSTLTLLAWVGMSQP